MLASFEVIRGKGLREGQLAKTVTLSLGLRRLSDLVDVGCLEMLGHIVGRGNGQLHRAVYGVLEGSCRMVTVRPT